jgi:aspartyl-tRNA(Asn)/glutamyl-tRNA(Gln) amidotransferase subunit A
MKPYELTYTDARKLMESGELSSRELIESVLGRIAEVDGSVRAYLALADADAALAAAGRIDDARARGETLGPLAGHPVAVKDNIATRGVPTTAGSRALDGYVPPFDATAVERLRIAGAVLIGKTNLDEFAMGSSCENSAFGTTRNPWDLERVPGGSSGGSAAAVAAGESSLALGSDTGGSVRQPAGFCGVVGLKPSYGRVSRYGLVAFASSLDQIGAMARDVDGAAALLSAIAGADPRDSTTAPLDVPDYTTTGAADLRGVRLGVPTEYFSDGLDAEVERLVRGAIDVMAGLGAQIVEISLPTTPYGIAAYYLVADAEASSNLARYDGVKYGFRSPGASDLRSMYSRTRGGAFGAEVKRRIMLGTYVLSAGYYDRYYRKAQQVRALIARDLRRVFDAVDAIVTPTSPTTAFRIGERIDDPLSMYLSDVYTVPASLAGVPAVSLPCGTSSAGLPVGVQMVADSFQEAELLRMARAYEAAAALPSSLPVF